MDSDPHLIVKWHKKTRIYEHLQTKMHAERKESNHLRMIKSKIDHPEYEQEDFDEEFIGASIYK